MDDRIKKLVAEGKDPLEALWVKPSKEDLDKRLDARLNRIPPELRERLEQRIKERVEREARKRDKLVQVLQEARAVLEAANEARQKPYIMEMVRDIDAVLAETRD